MVAKTSASKLLKNLREDLQDEYDPYLWSDSELLRYIDGGQIEFCRKGIPIFDSSSPLTRLQVTAGKPDLPYHESILDVKSALARYQNEVGGPYTYSDLVLSTHNHFLARMPLHARDYGATRGGESLMFSTGEPFDIFLDVDQNALRLARIPDRDFTVLLSVERLPELEVNDCDVPIEVHRANHPAVLAWAAYQAFLRQDSETFDPQAAARFKMAFDDYATQAQDDKLRRHSTPGPAHYGGI